MVTIFISDNTLNAPNQCDKKTKTILFTILSISYTKYCTFTTEVNIMYHSLTRLYSCTYFIYIVFYVNLCKYITERIHNIS